MATISRQEYNNLFGPTVGDKIRLGDTDLYVEIEKDLREYGDEVVYGGGKTIRFLIFQDKCINPAAPWENHSDRVT